MEQVALSPSAERVVFDWNNMAIGIVKAEKRDPRTREVRELVVNLNDAAKNLAGSTEAVVTIPASFIFGLRRDQVTLDRSFDEIFKATNLLTKKQV